MSTPSRSLVDIITDRVMARMGPQLVQACSHAETCVSNLPQPAHEDLRQLMDNGACRLACSVKASTFPPDIAATIDHTLLKPEATEEEIRKICQEAAEHHFASVCVNPGWVPLCAELLGGTGVEVCTVIGFPLGANRSETKAYETRLAVQQGATEVDMVINIGALKGKDFRRVHDDIRSVVEATGGNACTKVILETSKLSDDEKIAACTLAKEAGADYVKTSTGFGGGGATSEDISLMRKVVGGGMGVKASGGVRDRQTADALISAGANRIGASAGIKIVQGERAEGGGY